MAKITKDNVLHTAELAVIAISEEEAEKYSEHLSNLLATTEKIQNINTDGVKPTIYDNNNDNVLRKDKPKRTIKELDKSLHKDNLTVEDKNQMSLDRIKEDDNQIKAIVTVDEKNALAKARKLDESTETKGKLFCVPNSMKDNIMTKCLLTTC